MGHQARTLVLAAVSVMLVMAAVVAGEPIVATYDATGTSPQCSEGDHSYMTDCVFPTDMFFYIPAVRPTFGPVGTGCAALGKSLGRNWTFVSHDAIFTGMSFFWEGGSSAWNEFNDAFHKGHDAMGDIGAFLNNTRDHTAACANPPSPPPPPPPSQHHAASDSLQLAHPAQDAAGTPPHAHADAIAAPFAAADDNATAAYFDAGGSFGQCSEGELGYLRDCVVKADYLSFMQSTLPTLKVGTCAQYGFGLVKPDPVFNFSIWWLGGAESANKWFGTFLPGHADLVTILNHSRDTTRACDLTRELTAA